MDRTLNFANVNWGRILNSNNGMYIDSLNLCKNLRKHLFSIVRLDLLYFLGMPKVRAWSKLSKFRILLYCETVVRGQNL